MPRKRRDKIRKEKRVRQAESEITVEKPVARSESSESGNVFYRIYKNNYKALILIPAIVLILAIGIIGIQWASTGDFINKGVSLKGGVTLTVLTTDQVDIVALQKSIIDKFPGQDVVVRTIQSSGTTAGVLIEAAIDSSNPKEVSLLSKTVAEFFKTTVNQLDYSMEVMGSSLGESFFKQTFIAVIIAFVFMGIVVFYYFRIPVPSGAVILAAFSDIIITLAVVDLMKMRISTAGIAAFLMLIGYSVDTDILLSTRVLKRSGGTVLDRTIKAMKTGLTMNFTTLAAILVALFISESDVLKQIMTILLIGLLADLINTWLQNAGILRWYLEKHSVDLKKLD